MEAATLAEEIHTVVSTAASWPELAPGEADKQVSKFWSTRLPVSNLTHENQTWKFTAFSSSLNGQEVCKGPYQTSKTFKVCYEPAGWKYTSPLSPVAQASLSLFIFKKTVLVFKSLPILTPGLAAIPGLHLRQGSNGSLVPMARVDSLDGCADSTVQTLPVQGQHRAGVWCLHKGSTTMAEAVLDHRICPAGRRVQAEDEAGRGRASPALNQAMPESRLLPRFKATHRSPSCSS